MRYKSAAARQLNKYAAAARCVRRMRAIKRANQGGTDKGVVEEPTPRLFERIGSNIDSGIENVTQTATDAGRAAVDAFFEPYETGHTIGQYIAPTMGKLEYHVPRMVDHIKQWPANFRKGFSYGLLPTSLDYPSIRENHIREALAGDPIAASWFNTYGQFDSDGNVVLDPQKVEAQRARDAELERQAARRKDVAQTMNGHDGASAWLANYGRINPDGTVSVDPSKASRTTNEHNRTNSTYWLNDIAGPYYRNPNTGNSLTSPMPSQTPRRTRPAIPAARDVLTSPTRSQAPRRTHPSIRASRDVLSR